MKVVPSFPRFKGKFLSFTVRKSDNREHGTQDVFVVFSSGKRHALHRYLWLKLVWDELTKEEFCLFISMKESLENDKIVGFLRAKLIIPKKILRQRLIKLETFLGQKVSKREEYQGLQRIRFEFHEVQRKLPKVRKYSGYIRTPSAAGSKRSQKSLIDSGDLLTGWVEENVIDFYHLLSVGEIELFLGSFVFRPDESNKTETEDF